MDKMKEMIDQYEIDENEVQDKYADIKNKFAVFQRLQLLEIEETNDISNLIDLKQDRFFMKNMGYYFYQRKDSGEVVLVREPYGNFNVYKYNVYSLPSHTEEEYKKLYLIDEVETEGNKTSLFETRLLFGTVIAPIVIVLQAGRDFDHWYIYLGLLIIYMFIARWIIKANKDFKKQEIKRRQKRQPK